MLIAYLTTDEVNKDLAYRMAEECGATLHILSLQNAPPDGPFDAVLYDWDYLPLKWRQEFLSGLLAGSSSCPASVHSYNLDETALRALRQHGVAVFQRLEPEVFKTLRRAIQKARTVVRSDGGHKERADPEKALTGT